MCIFARFSLVSFSQGSGGTDFKRINYEFDLDADSLQEIPTAVAHSVGDDEDDAEDGDDGERQTNYLMEVRTTIKALCPLLLHKSIGATVGSVFGVLDESRSILNMVL